MSNLIEIGGKKSFDAFVLNSDKPVVVDFWAAWCGPCKMVLPLLDNIAGEYADKVNFYKVNVDENSELSKDFGIRNIPAIFFFDKGEIIEKHIGGATKAVLVEKVNKLLNEY